MSECKSLIRRLLPAAALGALLLSLCGCAELEGKLEQGGTYVRDLLLNSISRFPEGADQPTQSPEDATLPPEFVLVPPAEPEVVGVVSEDVNVRSGPDVEYDHLGSLLAGTEVKIHHQILLGNSPWGLTDAGWISMNYVELNDPAQAISVPQTDGKTCLIVIPDLEVRVGPGWQYDSADVKMEGYTTQLVKAQSGAWVLLEEGWVSKDGIYMGGTEQARTGTVTGSEVNIRTGPGTEYKRVGKVYRGDSLTVFHQVAVGEKFWGYTSAGWISMSYVKLDKVNTDPGDDSETPSVTLAKGVIEPLLGAWQQAFLMSDSCSVVFAGSWEFMEDGSFTHTGEDSYHNMLQSASEAPEGESTRMSGMYTCDGSVLTLFCTEDSAAEEGMLPYVRLVQVSFVEGKLVMTSGDTGATLYSGTRNNVAEDLLKK